MSVIGFFIFFELEVCRDLYAYPILSFCPDVGLVQELAPAYPYFAPVLMALRTLENQVFENSSEQKTHAMYLLFQF